MAEPLFERALVMYEETLDPCHPTVSETLHNFALLKYEQVDFVLQCISTIPSVLLTVCLKVLLYTILAWWQSW